HPRYGATLASLGAADVALGRVGPGIAALERGIAIMTAIADPPLDHLGDARFALARALSAGDRARARAEARLAREHYVAYGPICARELAAVDAWLAGHP
ncbi:MAG: hypothetical protein JNK56_14295, partial [Myxococcales bacterium]|nr:hypothetical protein [Myxococcales bacterium]